MGCDGGTIPRRDELVKIKKKPEQVSLVFYFTMNVRNIISEVVFPCLCATLLCNFNKNAANFFRMKTHV